MALLLNIIALGLGICIGTHKRRQNHIEKGKHGHQGGTLPLGVALGAQQLNRPHKQGIVSQRAEKLRDHDDVETLLHHLKVQIRRFQQRFKRNIKSQLNQRISFLECKGIETFAVITRVTDIFQHDPTN